MAGHENEIDQISGTETTGHEWDGIKELNTPLPRWWLWTFYATIIFSLVYVVLYPAIPLINGATQGVLGWSSRALLREEIAEAEAANADKLEAMRTLELSEIAADAELRQFAINAGNAAFKVNCVQCHGAGAAGSPGYPNLNDDEWIWGGDLEAIHLTIVHGIRYVNDDDSRISDMPAFGADELLAPDEISDTAWYVLSLSGQDADAAAAGRGETLYVDNCAACHGEAGEGVRDLGAPALNDAIWLYGGDHTQIVSQINAPSHGVMPGWQGRLADETVKALAVYVHALGGGE